MSHRNSMNHLKRQMPKCTDYKERRALRRKITKKKEKIKDRNKKKRMQYITSPLVKDIDNKGKQRKMPDYAVNIRAILSSFYVGTGGPDIGLINSCQGISGSENWERAYTRNSQAIMKAIIKAIDEIIGEALDKEVALTIKEKLKGKYTDSEIEELMKKLTGSTTGIDEVDNVRISISFDMGW